MKNTLFIFLLGTLICIPNLTKAQSTDDLNLGEMVHPVPFANRFLDSNYNIWCGSVCKGDNGKYYLFYSRWPKKDGHYAWAIESEIALAVADNPNGPYMHLKVVLPARGKQYWDGTTTHNPTIMRFKGKYFLYYMGTPVSYTHLTLPTKRIV